MHAVMDNTLCWNCWSSNQTSEWIGNVTKVALNVLLFLPDELDCYKSWSKSIYWAAVLLVRTPCKYQRSGGSTYSGLCNCSYMYYSFNMQKSIWIHNTFTLEADDYSCRRLKNLKLETSPELLIDHLCVGWLCCNDVKLYEWGWPSLRGDRSVEWMCRTSKKRKRWRRRTSRLAKAKETATWSLFYRIMKWGFFCQLKY